MYAIRSYYDTPHESPLIMTIPLMILAFASIFAGYIPFNTLVTSDLLPFHTHLHFPIAAASVAIGFVGIGAAWFLYRKKSDVPTKLSNQLGVVYTTVYHKFYIDEVYLFVTKRILFNYVSRPIAWFDKHVIDATMDLMAAITNKASEKIKGLQSGQLSEYAAFFAAGAGALVLFMLYLLN